MALSNYKISTLVLFIMYDVCFVKHTNISYELITCSGINRLFSQPPQKNYSPYVSYQYLLCQRKTVTDNVFVVFKDMIPNMQALMA